MTSRFMEEEGVHGFYDDSTKGVQNCVTSCMDDPLCKSIPHYSIILAGFFDSDFQFLIFFWNVRLVTTISFGEPWCGTSICLPSSSFDSSLQKFKQGNFAHKCSHHARIRVQVGPRPRDYSIFAEEIFYGPITLILCFVGRFYLVSLRHFGKSALCLIRPWLSYEQLWS